MSNSEPRVIWVTSQSFGQYGDWGRKAADRAGVTLRGPGSADLGQAKTEVQGVIAGTEPWTDAMMSECPRLRMVMRMGVGYDNVDLEAAQRRGIRVGFTPGAPAGSVANHTLMLMLLGLSRGYENLQLVHQTRVLGRTLLGKTVGLVGFGRIGQWVSDIIPPGNGILFYDPYLGPGESDRPYVERVEKLSDLLAQCDVVSLHTPLTAETYHMIDEEALWLMQPGCILVNTSRGGVIDEAGLVRYLTATEGRRHGGVLLDVTEQEPYPVPGPLMPFLANGEVKFKGPARTVYLSNHTASMTAHARQRMESLAVAGLANFLECGSPKPAAYVPLPGSLPWPPYAPPRDGR